MATSVLRGAATVLDLLPYRSESINKRFERFRAIRFSEKLKHQTGGIRHDWEQVGNDLRTAINTVDAEQHDEKKR